jgi:hypothetical protein
MKAFLMCGNLFLGIYGIREARPTIHLAFQSIAHLTAATAYSPSSSTNTSTSADVMLMRSELIFRLVRRVDYDAFEYQFDQEVSHQKYEFSMYPVITELEEPSVEIHLNQLKSRLRDNLKLKDLLIRYYADGQNN